MIAPVNVRLSGSSTPRRKKKRTGKNEPVRKKQTLSETQNISFIANCTCRDEPESPVGKRVLVMTPNDVLPT
jgi:hypothetical protein